MSFLVNDVKYGWSLKHYGHRMVSMTGLSSDGFHRQGLNLVLDSKSEL